ncbi:MAG: proliferating cell nuclear antigen (pcna), partial [Candidatus Diapherotrites archaeon]
QDAAVFKRFVDGIAVLVDEAEFVISNEGVYLKATDPSQVSLVDFSLPNSSFKVFELPQPLRLGVDLNYLNQVFSRAKANDVVEISLSADSKFSIVFSGVAKRSFVVPLLDLASQEIPVPKIDFDAELKMNAGLLQDCLKDVSLVSTHVVLSVVDGCFVVSANSSKGNVENSYSVEEHSLISLSAKSNCKAMFPLDYLTNFFKAASSDTEVVLKLKSDAPIEVSYSFGGATLRYFLAPRIEDSQ